MKNRLKKITHKCLFSKNIIREFYQNKKGQRHGYYNTFGPNSQKDSEGCCFNSVFNGVWKYQHGQMSAIDTRKNVMNGIKVIFS